MEAFDILRRKLSVYPKDKKIVLFFDEFPWFDTQKSDFPSAKEYVFQPDFEPGSSWICSKNEKTYKRNLP